MKRFILADEHGVFTIDENILTEKWINNKKMISLDDNFISMFNDNFVLMEYRDALSKKNNEILISHLYQNTIGKKKIHDLC